MFTIAIFNYFKFNNWLQKCVNQPVGSIQVLRSCFIKHSTLYIWTHCQGQSLRKVLPQVPPQPKCWENKRKGLRQRAGNYEGTLPALQDLHSILKLPLPKILKILSSANCMLPREHIKFHVNLSHAKHQPLKEHQGHSRSHTGVKGRACTESLPKMAVNLPPASDVSGCFYVCFVSQETVARILLAHDLHPNMTWRSHVPGNK